jgi:hypothetical protein
LSAAIDKIKIASRSSAMMIEPGYSLGESDSTFVYNGHKYLVKNSEYFDDNGEITHVAIWKSEGYLVFSKRQFSKLKDFLAEHNFSKTIDANIIDNHQILLNSQKIKVEIIDKKRKEIFYRLNNKDEIIYRLIYENVQY